MEWVLASGNRKKLAELADILAPLGVAVRPQSDFDVPDAEETGLTFVENAIIKARHAARLTGLPAISDDSGLEVDALQGAPGIYSARFAGPAASDAENNRKLVESLRALPDAPRQARYQCVIVFMRHANDPVPVICQGSWDGEIQLTPTGNGGFGYDPYFFVPEAGCSAAEMAPGDKHRSSHRGKALSQFMAIAKERLIDAANKN